MNEKVKQLVKEVGGMQVHDTRGYGDGHGSYLLTPDQIEKMIQLVVEECADQIIQRGRDRVDFAPSKTAIRPEYWDMAQHIKKYWS